MTDLELTQAITNVADGTPNTALELRTILFELQSRSVKSKTIVMKDVSQQYIVDNFDIDGLGKNLELGYAICNGNNGTTRDWAGRVPVAYGGAYTTIGERDGSKDAVVVEHSHTYLKAVVGRGYDVANDDQPLSGLVLENTSTEGVSGTNKNMQPYIVTLVTMKL